MTRLAYDSYGSPVQALKPGVVQNVAFTGTSAQSAALGAATTLVELSCDQKCWLRINAGTNPTATVGTAAPGLSIPLAADQKIVYGVIPLDKIAVIRDSTSGTLTIVEGQ